MVSRPKLFSAIKESLVPDVTETYNLGNSTLKWLSIFVVMITATSLQVEKSIQVGDSINWTSGSFLSNTTWYAAGSLNVSNALFINSSSGNVGIGSSGLNYTLVTSGDINIAGGDLFLKGSLRIDDNSSASYTAFRPKSALLAFLNGDSTSWYNVGNSRLISVRHDGTYGRIQILDSGGGFSPIGIYNNNTIKITVSVGGDVGIGVGGLNATDLLEVAGNFRINETNGCIGSCNKGQIALNESNNKLCVCLSTNTWFYANLTQV